MKTDIIQFLGNLLIILFFVFFAFVIINSIYLFIEHLRQEKIDFYTRKNRFLHRKKNIK